MTGRSDGKSQFLFRVRAQQTVSDAAAYADKNNLWNAEVLLKELEAASELPTKYERDFSRKDLDDDLPR